MKKFFSKDRLRAIISFLLSFLVCLGLFFTAVLADVLIFSVPSFIRACAEKSNYTEFAVSQITEELNDLAIPSGLPDDFFTDKIDENDFAKLFYSCLDNLASGNKDYKLSVEEFKGEVYKRVTDYSKNEAGDFSSEVEKDIERFSKECSNIYLSYVNPSLTSYLFELLTSAKTYIVLALIISVVFTLGVGGFLFKINNKSVFFKYCFASLCGASLTLGVIPSCLIITNEISRISISSKSLYAITTTLAEQFLWIMIITAIVIFIISLIFLFIKNFNLIFKK